VHHVVDFAEPAVRPRLARALAVARFRRRMVPTFHLDADRFQAVAFIRPV